MRKEKHVAVTGIGIVCSLGNNRYEVIKNMEDGKVGISTIDSFSTDKFLTHIGAEAKQFNLEENFNKDELSSLDKVSCLAITAAKEAISDSSIVPEQEKMGLAFGTCNGGIKSLENYSGVDEIPSESFLKYTFFGQSDAIAKYFKIKGPVNTINSACAASGNAIAYASDMIKYGYADMMLAGGADAMSLAVYAGFNSLKALNSEPCSPYGVKTGLSLGEGAAFVILEDLDKALARNAHIYAEICGYGLSNDAYHATAPEPNGLGIKKAVDMAIENAGVPKEKIGYINTHGTGTLANDSAELRGLRQSFGDLLDNIPISSSKAYFGHTLGTAAALEYTTALLAIKDGYLPATMNFTEAREGCDLKNIIVNNMLKVEDEVQYFLTNNSAFGGHNCSIISKLSNYDQEKKEISNNRVVIVGAGSVVGSGYTKGTIDNLLNMEDCNYINGEFSLKEYNKGLYVRRMNKLCQMSIGATDLAINDANIDRNNINDDEIGMCYGTSRGSLASAEKYLKNIFNGEADKASSIYFPDMVLNSTSGTMSKILKIKGYSSSSSNGGNEGISTMLNCYQVVKNNIHKYCIAGAGDEKSLLSEKIDYAYGLDKSKYSLIEGSTSIVLTSYENAVNNNHKIYGEILGFGMNDNLETAINAALENASVSNECIDLIIYNTPAINEDLQSSQNNIKEILKNQSDIISINEELGYGESSSSLNQVSLALSKINNENYNKAMIISRSLADHISVAIISK